MRLNGRVTTDVGALAALVAADGPTGGFIKDSQGGSLPATATNDDASAGTVGEYLDAELASGSAISLTHATPANVTSLELSAGDWAVYFDAVFTGNAATQVWYLVASLSATSATIDASPGRIDARYVSPDSFAIYNIGFNTFTARVGPVRISLASATTFYGVVQSGFSTNANTAYGLLRAWRER